MRGSNNILCDDRQLRGSAGDVQSTFQPKFLAVRDGMCHVRAGLAERRGDPRQVFCTLRSTAAAVFHRSRDLLAGQAKIQRKAKTSRDCTQNSSQCCEETEHIAAMAVDKSARVLAISTGERGVVNRPPSLDDVCQECESEPNVKQQPC